jgi:hypothetical protein
MNEATDYDGAWKEALEIYLQPFLRLCFPAVAQRIDWSAPVEFLDKELQEIVRDAHLGKQWVDKLIKVRRLDGDEQWVLLHVEVQAQLDAKLPQRVYQYHHRIVDRFGRLAATLVVLADQHEAWAPSCYEEELWGCRVRFEYPVCKLLTLAREGGPLEDSANPAAVVVAAHLAAQRTGTDMAQRHRLKWQLTRRLYDHGYRREDILELYRLIDWLMRLPEDLEKEFRRELHDYEQERVMPYVTSIERLGRQEGRIQALQETILDVLEARFGAVPYRLREQIQALQDEAALKRFHRQAVQVGGLEEFTRAVGTPQA